MTDKTLLIVTGPMRSGTTMLADLLYSTGAKTARHPSLSFANDNVTTIRQFSERLTSKTVGTERQMNSSLGKALQHEWLAIAQDSSFLAQLERDILDAAPAAGEVKVLGVKNTCLLPELYWLARLGQVQTKVIVCIRDPRDCVASYLARHSKMYGKDKKGLLLALINASFMLDYLALRDEPQFSDSILLVKYEDVVGDPRKAILSILRFIGLDQESYDWDSLDANRLMSNSSFLPTEDANGVQENAGFMPSIGHYQSVDQDLVRVIERLNRPVFSQFGYQPKYGDFNFQVALKLPLLIANVRECATVYDFAIDGLKVVTGPFVWGMASLLISIRRRLRDLRQALTR